MKRVQLIPVFLHKHLYFLILVSAFCFPVLTVENVKAGESAKSEILTVDYAKLVSKADLTYTTPVVRSEEGMPVGNGTMGTLVWTTPSSLKLQLNRVDVFANDASSDNFYERHTDYCGGVGFVDFDFICAGESTFSGPKFKQYLSCYNGLVTVQGKGIKAEVFASANQDVLLVRITPYKNLPLTVLAKVRSLRPLVVKKGDHSAISKLNCTNNQLLLEQKFSEENYYCGSSMAMAVSDKKAKAEISSKEEIRFTVPPGNEPVTFYISTAASFDPKIDLATKTLELTNNSRDLGFEKLLVSSGEWWKSYWEKSFVHLSSADGVANFVEQNYTYFLYVMGSGSRGKIPPKFNGMIWSTDDDARKWGNLFWGANQSCMYNGLFPANRSELMDPYFGMYSEMFETCALAARQQWGSKGIYIPETVGFSGLPELPVNVAGEMRKLLLVEKSWDDRSEEYKNFAHTKMPFLSRWNQKTDKGWKDGLWLDGDKGGGASEILEVDAELREQWKEILEHLAPLPLNTDLENVTGSEKKQWIKALPPVGKGNYASHPDPNTMPVWFFDLCNLESDDPENLNIANATFDSYFSNRITAESSIYVLSKLPVAGSILGQKESTKYLIPNQIKTAESDVLPNRMTLREGYQTTGVQRLGRVADALHLALFQSAPKMPGEKPVIRVFPAWPENWDASFSLLGRGNFLITSSIKNNKVEFVEITSQSGLPCKIINPWEEDEVSIFSEGKIINSLEGEVLSFSTHKDLNYILVKKGNNPNQFKQALND